MGKIGISLATGTILVIGAACGTVPGDAKATPISNPFASASSKPKNPKPKQSKWSEGTYKVGTEIKPGDYRTLTTSDYGCLWERLRGTSGDTGDTISNEYGEGQMRMTVKPSDKYIKFFGDCEWVAAK